MGFARNNWQHKDRERNLRSEFCLKVIHEKNGQKSTLCLGNFSNDDGDGNENVKTPIGLLSKTTSLHVHHAFLYISLPLLHDYDVKMANITFY